jgi:hypothetical protein
LGHVRSDLGCVVRWWCGKIREGGREGFEGEDRWWFWLNEEGRIDIWGL